MNHIGALFKELFYRAELYWLGRNFKNPIFRVWCYVERNLHEQGIYKKNPVQDRYSTNQILLHSKRRRCLKAVSELKYPLMIKPVSEGSSFGMSKVENENELIKAVRRSPKI